MHELVQRPERVTLGVDTHAEVHVAAALDERGRLLGTCTIATTPAGFAELVRWAEQSGEVVRVGMEGTGSYGAGLARWLRARDVAVVEVEVEVEVEVDRPDRRTRRRCQFAADNAPVSRDTAELTLEGDSPEWR